MYDTDDSDTDLEKPGKPLGYHNTVSKKVLRASRYKKQKLKFNV